MGGSASQCCWTAAVPLTGPMPAESCGSSTATQTSLARGLTPRQVPIPGVHAKWLQAHRAAVLALTGLDDLGLLANHPARIHFTYLDPDHRADGRRLHDSATVGDTFTPAYQPEVVVISENKDTAIHFPELAGGLIVEGVGRGGRTVASFPWIREAPLVVYWGDMDRDGYEILNGYRIEKPLSSGGFSIVYLAYDETGTPSEPTSSRCTCVCCTPSTLATAGSSRSAFRSPEPCLKSNAS